ncbi:MAG: U32 family peptidase [Verrucomicrobia bacterium]|nr:U32 family peptidase [Verrucomicrobiota bacterium]
MHLQGRTATKSPTPSPALLRPELLAPAGDWECVRAAVENGADAIYFGLTKFNARMRAQNFTEADLPELMEFLHWRGVNGYVTFNTLIFADELPAAEQYLRSIISAGVDAAIVQDVGICRLIRRLSPDFPIHASTQMTITSAGGVAFARELGCNLVVLARECSIPEIEKIVGASERRALERGDDTDLSASRATLPIEVFVHGALCVAYSGQCLTSEALGGRSANRGECAQACRMPYELISDGRRVPLGDRRYLLSPQDLAGLEVLPDLIQAGVASLKIEGRLKSPEYVANITRVYRKALDHIFSNPVPFTKITPLVRESRYAMEMAFSRGLSAGWLRGVNNQELVHARFGKKRGVYLGAVTRVEGDRVALKLVAPLKPGDGIVFDAGKPDAKEEGGRVHKMAQQREECTISFGRSQIDFRRVHIGDKVWKTSDPDLDHRLRQTFSGDQIRFQRPLDFEIHGCAGLSMTILCRDDAGHVVRVSSVMPLGLAERQPLTTELLRQHLGRLGGTPFKLRHLANDLSGDLILPISEINRLRREAIDALKMLRSRPKRWKLNSAADGSTTSAPGGTSLDICGSKDSAHHRDSPVQLIVLVRSLAQLQAAVRCDAGTLYCEFEDPRKYRQAVQQFHAWQARSIDHSIAESQLPRANRQAVDPNPQRAIFVAPPRIFKPGEEWILKQVQSCGADGYLARNYDHLAFFKDSRLVGDFSLNIANRLSAEYFMARFRLVRLTASYDLNVRQLEALLQSAPPEWFEVTVHQHMPMFHMEHCVFCAFLSHGTDYRNCGRPCDRHAVALRDRVGAEHPLKADAGCRNTVFNGLAQTGAEHVTRLLNLGVRRFRLEFLNESEEQVVRTIGKYRQLLQGEITGNALWRELKLLNQLGVTRGPM